jgi:hypothetical protein
MSRVTEKTDEDITEEVRPASSKAKKKKKKVKKSDGSQVPQAASNFV